MTGIFGLIGVVINLVLTLNSMALLDCKNIAKSRSLFISASIIALALATPCIFLLLHLLSKQEKVYCLGYTLDAFGGVGIWLLGTLYLIIRLVQAFKRHTPNAFTFGVAWAAPLSTTIAIALPEYLSIIYGADVLHRCAY